MLVYQCSTMRRGGPATFEFRCYSFEPSGNLDGEYPCGISDFFSVLYGLNGTSVGWFAEPVHLMPAILVTGVTLEEVALNAVLC